MASLVEEAGRKFFIWYSLPGGERKKFWLGEIERKQAEGLVVHVEAIEDARRFNQPLPASERAWLDGLDSQIHDRLSRWGLVEPRASSGESWTFGAWLNRWLEGVRLERAAGTVKNYEDTAGKLRAFFNPDFLLTAVSKSDARDWRQSLIRMELSEATVNKHVRQAKVCFSEAVERELIARNPFDGLPTAAVPAKRGPSIERAIVLRVAGAIESKAASVALMLARFAGLRAPSETHGLRWADVDLKGKQLTVKAPKTGTVRSVPIVPELWGMLSSLRGRGKGAGETVVPGSSNNLHRAIKRGLEACGMVPWPRLMQALRQACETDWRDLVPPHVVGVWMGHGAEVGERFYATVEARHYERVTGRPESVDQRVDQQGGSNGVRRGKRPDEGGAADRKNKRKNAANTEWPRSDSNRGPRNYEYPALDR